MVREGMQTDLLTEIETFLTRSGMSTTAFGLGAIRDGKLVTDLRNGRRLWPETEARVRQWMADNAHRCATAEAAE